MTGTILITGASSGIGRATAEHFAARGWTVGALARSAGPLEEMAGGEGNILPLPADVTDAAAVEAAVARLVEKAGRLDVLFNNAGMFGAAELIDDLPLETFEKVVNVNIHGMFNAARAAFGQMRRQSPRGGRIVNNGSISAQVPRHKSVAYTMTKHAVTGLTKALSLDGRDLDIACGQIDIGNARTPMVEAQHERARAEGKTPDASMDVQAVVNALWYMAGLPLEANVQFMTVMARQMPFIGRG
jgi:NAD(P)-dependent dehydrogenase (short-subunit alcohol dehydrogenase family)